jgi:hypothetical protein
MPHGLGPRGSATINAPNAGEQDANRLLRTIDQLATEPDIAEDDEPLPGTRH